MDRRSAFRLFVLLLAPLLLGMGTLGQSPVREEAPQTKKRFDALITDTGGVTCRVVQISYDGELYFPLYEGKALIVVPFDKIASMEFDDKKGEDRREVKVVFRGQVEPRKFRIDPDVLLLGRVPYGTFQIQAKDIRKIEFVEPSTK